MVLVLKYLIFYDSKCDWTLSLSAGVAWFLFSYRSAGLRPVRGRSLPSVGFGSPLS